MPSLERTNMLNYTLFILTANRRETVIIISDWGRRAVFPFELMHISQVGIKLLFTVYGLLSASYQTNPRGKRTILFMAIKRGLAWHTDMVSSKERERGGLGGLLAGNGNKIGRHD